MDTTLLVNAVAMLSFTCKLLAFFSILMTTTDRSSVWSPLALQSSSICTPLCTLIISRPSRKPSSSTSMLRLSQLETIPLNSILRKPSILSSREIIMTQLILWEKFNNSNFMFRLSWRRDSMSYLTLELMDQGSKTLRLHRLHSLLTTLRLSTGLRPEELTSRQKNGKKSKRSTKLFLRESRMIKFWTRCKDHALCLPPWRLRRV